jgi:hypothetical protein
MSSAFDNFDPFGSILPRGLKASEALGKIISFNAAANNRKTALIATSNLMASQMQGFRDIQNINQQIQGDLIGGGIPNSNPSGVPSQPGTPGGSSNDPLSV